MRRSYTLAVLAAVAGAVALRVAQAAPPSQQSSDSESESSSEHGAAAHEKREAIVLLHGLGRSSRAMSILERRLSRAGYRTINIDYPSRDLPIAELVEVVHAQILECCGDGDQPLHFVTHSLGGILTRAYLSKYQPEQLGRVVMLSPPNHGSPWVDFLREHVVPEPWMPPAMAELGTNPESTPNQLGPVAFELGVITGSRSWHPFSSLLMDGPSDGTVSVESARIEGMADFYVVPRSHSVIMFDNRVTSEILHFLEHGRFEQSTRSHDPS